MGTECVLCDVVTKFFVLQFKLLPALRVTNYESAAKCHDSSPLRAEVKKKWSRTSFPPIHVHRVDTKYVIILPKGGGESRFLHEKNWHGCLQKQCQ